MAIPIDTDPDLWQSAASAVGDRVGPALADAAGALNGTLAQCGGMAGSDPAGHAWAAAYDPAAADLASALADATNACFQLAAMLQASGYNYAAAEAASDPTRTIPAPSPSPSRASGPFGYSWQAGIHFAPTPPPAAGGGVGAPHGWHLIASVIGYLWPNGHQDTLHAMSAAWQVTADNLAPALDGMSDATTIVRDHGGPEADQVMMVLADTYTHLSALQDTCHQLADACDDYAHHLDAAHHAIIAELEDLLTWTAAIEGAGGLFAVITAGISEALAQGGEATRIAISAGRIGPMIAGLIEAAGTIANRIRNITETISETASNLRTLANAKIQDAVTNTVNTLPHLEPALAGTPGLRAGTLIRDGEGVGRTAKTAGTTGRAAEEATTTDLPALTSSQRQLESKFKHAADFGVSESRGATGFASYRAAVERFVERPDTIRIIGEYRGQEVILNYSPISRLVVVQSTDGAFVSGWQMSEDQLAYVVTKGVLGGG